jgi:glycosyltransferase involved in cell wall biosynthesis
MSNSSFITVVIPVYNAGRFVRQACESALKQTEVAQVILIEDGSKDDSLAVCEELAREDRRVLLLRHPNGANLGAGGSRNLGIRKALTEWIAFLDADDFYLDDRFSSTVAIINEHPDADAICEAVGVHFETEEAKASWPGGLFTTLQQRYTPDELFWNQAPIGRGGFCSVPGWTVKKNALERCGLFPEHLRLHQDTSLFVKLAAMTRVYPGEIIKPVSMYRVHDNNRITALPQTNWFRCMHPRGLFWLDLCAWAKKTMPKKVENVLYDLYLNEMFYLPLDVSVHWAIRHVLRILRSCLLVLKFPSLLLAPKYYRFIFDRFVELFCARLQARKLCLL